MAEVLADFVTVLSSDMIAEIVEAYFNKQMYKKPVKVVDLQPQGTGYAFSLAFITTVNKAELSADKVAEFYQEQINNTTPLNKEQVDIIKGERDNKGRFVKH